MPMRFLAVLLALLASCMFACQQQMVSLDKSDAEAKQDTRRYNPYELIFSVSPQPYVEKFASTEQTVPKIGVMFDEHHPNHQYQVQRCHSSLFEKIKDQYGNDPLTANYTKSKAVSAHLYAWGKANASGCIFLGERHQQKVFEDITAPSGEYFYLLRACLVPARSQYGKRRYCHYIYHKTEVVKYTDTFEQEQWQLRLDLAALRNKLQARFARLSGVIINKGNFLEQCETNEARRNVFRARLAGISKIVITATATTTAAILSGGTAAFQTGAATIKLTDKLFSSLSNSQMRCDTSVFDKRITELKDSIDPIAASITVKLKALSPPL
ncbi:MAG: hypothetical protein OYH77_06360 [Pseudomonadota bacterium]|nr:hypothetical protein [Pseudomonadota bacterium]